MVVVVVVQAWSWSQNTRIFPEHPSNVPTVTFRALSGCIFSPQTDSVSSFCVSELHLKGFGLPLVVNRDVCVLSNVPAVILQV